MIKGERKLCPLKTMVSVISKIMGEQSFFP